MKKLKLQKKYVIAAVLCIILIGILIFSKDFFYLQKTENFNDESGTELSLSTKDGYVRQYLTVSENVTVVKLLVENIASVPIDMKAELHTAEDDALLGTFEAQAPPSADNMEAIEFDFNTASLTEGTQIYLDFYALNNPEQLIYCALQGDYSGQQAVLTDMSQVPIPVSDAGSTDEANGKAGSDIRLRMSVFYSGSFHAGYYILVILLTLSIVLIFLFPEKLKKPQNFFLLFAVIAGLSMAVITPPVQECDGADHLIRSMDVSYGNFLGSFVNLTHDGGEVLVPENMYDMDMSLLTINGGEGVSYVEGLKEMTFSDQPVISHYLGSVTSVVYWPQGIGILLGRLLGCNAYNTILLGRLLNLLVYILLVYEAIRRIPFFKAMFMVTGLLPISLFQASSLSQDSMVIGLALLFTALCLDYSYGKDRKLSWKHLLLLSLLLLPLLLAKYVYVCLGLLVFMIPWKRFETKKKYLMSFIIAILPLLILGGYAIIHNMSGVVSTQAAVSTADAVTQTQTGLLMSNPKFAVKLFMQTMQTQFSYYLISLNMLGTLNVLLQPLYVLCPCIIAVVGVLNQDHLSVGIRKKDRWLMGLAFLLIFLLTLIGLYIGDSVANPYGAPEINGVQGRYFVMLLPLPFIALGSRRIQNLIKEFETKTVAIAGCMLLYTIIQLIKAYYY